MQTPLDIHESNIDPTYLKINQPPTREFFSTVKSLYAIRENKLYKLRQFKSWEAYLLARWSLKRGLGNRLCSAGRVIKHLETDFSNDQLPSNATLCLTIELWANKRNESMPVIWTAALKHFDGRENVIACHFSEVFRTEDDATPVRAAVQKGGALLTPVSHGSSSDAMDVDDEQEDEEEEEETTPTQPSVIDEEHNSDQENARESMRLLAGDEENSKPNKLGNVNKGRLAAVALPDEDEDEDEDEDGAELEDEDEDEDACDKEIIMLSKPPLGKRKSREVSYAESAESAGLTSDESEPERAMQRSKKGKTRLFSTIRNILNTPQWLCSLIETFTGGVDLDVCANASSKLNAKTKYGYAEDGSFIDPLTLKDWEPNTNFVYLHPPPPDDTYVTEFWTKCFLEIEKGNVKRVLALIPQSSYGKWNAQVMSRALMCFLNVQVTFEDADGSFYDHDVCARSICYLDTDDSYPHAGRFVETFGAYGYIPNVSMRIYKVPKPDLHLRYFSLCSGIGVAETAIHSVFPNAICVGFSEIDAGALAVYAKHFPNHKNFGDALKLNADTLPDFDLLVSGIPCQPFSKQSINRKNFDDDRSKLFESFSRILASKAPPHFLMENVPMSSEPRAQITEALGVYPVEINSNDFTAQNRKRLFWCSWNIPPPTKKPSPKLEDIIEAMRRTPVSNYKNVPPNPPEDAVFSVKRNTATGAVEFRTDGKSNTITTGDCYQTIVAVKGIYRHYTIRERERLQGLPDDYTACESVKEAKKKQLIGNSMTLPVLKYIFNQM